jgi:hypothetical protein
MTKTQWRISLNKMIIDDLCEYFPGLSSNPEYYNDYTSRESTVTFKLLCKNAIALMIEIEHITVSPQDTIKVTIYVDTVLASKYHKNILCFKLFHKRAFTQTQYISKQRYAHFKLKTYSFTEAREFDATMYDNFFAMARSRVKYMCLNIMSSINNLILLHHLLEETKIFRHDNIDIYNLYKDYLSEYSCVFKIPYKNNTYTLDTYSNKINFIENIQKGENIELVRDIILYHPPKLFNLLDMLLEPK